MLGQQEAGDMQEVHQVHSEGWRVVLQAEVLSFRVES